MAFEGTNPTNHASVSGPVQQTVLDTSKQAPLPPAPAPNPDPPQIEDFDAFIKSDVQTFVDLGKQIGGLVGEQVLISRLDIDEMENRWNTTLTCDEQAEAVLQAFQAERTFILVTTKAKKPKELAPETLTELHKAVDTINNLRESNRTSPYFNHLSAIAEGTILLGWFLESKPAAFISDMVGSVQYYGNKVLKEYKDK